MVSITTKLIFLVCSNIAFALPSYTALKCGMVDEGIIFMLMGIVSGIYHIGDTDSSIKVIFATSTWRLMDFAMSFSLISRTMLMIMFSTGYDQDSDVWRRNVYIKYIANNILYTVTTLLVIEDVKTEWMVFILTLVCLVIVSCAMIFWRNSIMLDCYDFIVGWVFITIGSFCYFFGSDYQYWIVHSIWHVSAAIGIFFMVESKNTTWNVIRFITCGKYGNGMCGKSKCCDRTPVSTNEVVTYG